MSINSIRKITPLALKYADVVASAKSGKPFTFARFSKLEVGEDPYIDNKSTKLAHGFLSIGEAKRSVRSVSSWMPELVGLGDDGGKVNIGACSLLRVTNISPRLDAMGQARMVAMTLSPDCIPIEGSHLDDVDVSFIVLFNERGVQLSPSVRGVQMIVNAPVTYFAHSVIHYTPPVKAFFRQRGGNTGFIANP